MTASDQLSVIFQSTPPVRGATVVIVRVRYVDDISIHAPRAGGDFGANIKIPERQISIHAPRAGGDKYSADIFSV